MLTYDDALNLNYYKKTSFTGSMKGMRFLIKKEERVIEDTEETENIFHCWIWPGPYIFDKTDDSLKLDATFPFTEDGKIQAVDWINQTYTDKENQWPKKIRI